MAGIDWNKVRKEASANVQAKRDKITKEKARAEFYKLPVIEAKIDFVAPTGGGKLLYSYAVKINGKWKVYAPNYPKIFVCETREEAIAACEYRFDGFDIDWLN